MTKHLLLFAAYLFSFHFAAAQCFLSTWHNPSPQGNDLEKVTWITPDTVLAIGDRGALIRSIDAGNSWQVITGLPEWNYTDMVFTDSNTGYACGSINTSGIIIKTTDGGTTWSTLISGGIGTLGAAGSLWFTDANNGYCGTFGAIYRTTDAGATWTSSPTVSFTVNDLFFQTPLNGWAIANSRIVKTVDGGITWTQALNGGSNLLSAITFTDSNNGFATTSSGWYKTTDGGTTWTLSSLPISGSIQDFVFQSPQIGFICSGSFDSYIYKTTDGGATWTLVYTLAQINRLNSVAVSPVGNVACVGNLGALLVSYDNGNTGSWVNKRVQLGNGFYCLDMVSDQVGFFGSSGAIWKTTDGGNTLTSTTIPSGTRTPLSMHFPSPDTGYVVGADGMRYRTYNGGNTWTNLTVNTTSDIYDVHFLNNQIGYTCGENGSVGKTTDGFNSISPISIGQNILLYDVFFLNENHGYVCGANGAFYRTVNGGATWTAIPTGTTSSFMLSIYFVNDQLGFCSGGSGRLLRTTDGGVTWTTSLVGFGDDIYEVSFINENEGFYITGQLNGTLYRTFDGGITWNYWGILSNSTLLDFDITNDGSIYVVGFTAALWEVNPTVPTPDVPASAVVCSGNSFTVEAPEGFTTRWFANASTLAPIATSNTISYDQLNGDTEVWVAFVNANQCISGRAAIAIEYVSVESLPTIVTESAALCPGNTTELRSSDNSIVQWNTGAQAASIIIDAPGSFSFTVNHPQCGSLEVTPVTIASAVVPEAPTIIIEDYSPCASVVANVSTTSTDYVLWKNEDGEIIAENTTTFVTPEVTANTNFYAQSMSVDGCYSASTLISISANLGPVVNETTVQQFAVCTNDIVNIQVAETPYEVVWENSSTGNSIDADTPGDYYVTYVNGPCSSAPVLVAQVQWTDPITPTITAESLNFCEGDSVLISAQAAGEILWSNGVTTSSQWVSADETLTATATVQGCTGEASAAITLTSIPLPTAPELTTTAYSPCAATSVQLNSSSSHTIWLDENMNELLVNNAVYTTPILQNTATYFAYVRTNEGCTSSMSEVSVPFSIVQAPNISISSGSICAGNSTTLTAESNFDIVWSNGNTGNTVQVSEAGSYSAQAVNGECISDASNTVELEVIAVPDAPVLSFFNDTLVVTNAGNANIVWTQNGAVLSSTNDTLLIAGPAAVYGVQLFNDPCASETSTYNYVPDFIEESNTGWKVWPNPNNGVFNVQSNTVPEQIVVRDSMLREVYIQRVCALHTSIDVNALAVGLYTVEIVLENGRRITRKMIVAP